MLIHFLSMTNLPTFCSTILPTSSNSTTPTIPDLNLSNESHHEDTNPQYNEFPNPFSILRPLRSQEMHHAHWRPLAIPALQRNSNFSYYQAHSTDGWQHFATCPPHMNAKLRVTIEYIDDIIYQNDVQAVPANEITDTLLMVSPTAIVANQSRLAYLMQRFTAGKFPRTIKSTTHTITTDLTTFPITTRTLNLKFVVYTNLIIDTVPSSTHYASTILGSTTAMFLQIHRPPIPVTDPRLPLHFLASMGLVAMNAPAKAILKSLIFAFPHRIQYSSSPTGNQFIPITTSYQPSPPEPLLHYLLFNLPLQR